MKTIKSNFTVLALLVGLFFVSACTLLSELSSQLPSGDTNKPQLTNEEIVNGLKEALTVGSRKAVDILAVENGFYKDPLVFIEFPAEAVKVKEYALKLGMDQQVTKFEETLNRAAETAVKEAYTVFADAVTKMTFSDAKAILQGSDDAATAYFKRTTSQQLHSMFYPKVKQATEKVALTKYWDPLVTQYNKTTIVTGNPKIETDLNEYVTQKALDGLFLKLANEEKQIRKNPAARVTDILKKVFGSLTN